MPVEPDHQELATVLSAARATTKAEASENLMMWNTIRNRLVRFTVQRKQRVYSRGSSNLRVDVVVRIHKRTNRITFGHETRRSCDVTRAMIIPAIHFLSSQSSAIDDGHAQLSCNTLTSSVHFSELRKANYRYLH